MKSTAPIFLVAIACSAAFAQKPQTHPTHAEGTTYGVINGRVWNAISNDAKSFYLIGVAEGIIRESPAVFKKKYTVGTLSTEEVRIAIDRFFAEPENLLIPAIDALRIVAMKINGALQPEIDKELSVLRAISVKWHEEHKP
jgi:hypothetical protein